MEQITSNGFLNSVLEAAAWKELSGKIAFTMEMLDKYSKKLDWYEISRNSDILWTFDGLRKFSHKIDWVAFSSTCPESLISEPFLEKFADRIDWETISGRDCFYNNWELLEKFAEYAEWNEIISVWNVEKPVEFFKRFEKFIPMTKFQNSRLWDQIVEIKANELSLEIRGIK